MFHVVPEAAALPEVGDETTLEGAVTALKRRLLINAIEYAGGNKAAAAKRLGISRSYLHRLISELGITST
jgi:transcriptional regulator with GAF, ATPase, and Fis domain